MSAENVDVLRPKLQEAQKSLEAALAEACEVDVAAADSEQLMRLEESLTVAREAARTAIAALQRLHRAQPERHDAQATRTHRVFVDERGVQWDAFPVHPSRPSSGRSSLPHEYFEGWLSFQSEGEIRRLTPIPDGWQELSSVQLRQLLSKAQIAPRRKRSEKTDQRSPEARP